MFFELQKTICLEGQNMTYFHKVDSSLDTVLVVHDQENQFGKSPKAAKIEFEQWYPILAEHWRRETRRWENPKMCLAEEYQGPTITITQGPCIVNYQWWWWRRKTKGRVSPNLLLHNWVVEGRCVSCSTTDLEALVNQTRLLCSGVPDGASALLWCTRWVPRAGPAYLRPPLALHSIRRQTPQCTNAQIDKYFDRCYSNIKTV